MNNTLTRRDVLTVVPGACTAAALFGLNLSEVRGSPAPEGATNIVNDELPPGFPRQDIESVESVVGASHFNFDRVKELITKRPALAKASWDWGFGDWESALGAASHIGRRDIATLLIEHGARPNLFTFAMFGHLEAVKSAVEAVPGIQRIHGPHGITLLQHALNGGSQSRNSPEARERANKVAKYLESLGDADNTTLSLDISGEQKSAYLGRYTFGRGEDEVFNVLLNRRGALSIKRGDGVLRVLHRIEPDVFAPQGSPAARIRFQLADGRATSLTIHDPIPLVKAMRAAG